MCVKEMGWKEEEREGKREGEKMLLYAKKATWSADVRTGSHILTQHTSRKTSVTAADHLKPTHF